MDMFCLQLCIFLSVSMLRPVVAILSPCLAVAVLRLVVRCVLGLSVPACRHARHVPSAVSLYGVADTDNTRGNLKNFVN